MAKVDQTKASRLLSATKTMSLGADLPPRLDTTLS